MKPIAFLLLVTLTAFRANAACILDDAAGTYFDATAVTHSGGNPTQVEHFKNFSFQLTKFDDGTFRITGCEGAFASGATWTCPSGNFKIENGAIIATGVLVNNDQQHPQTEKIGSCSAKSARFTFANEYGKHVWMYTNIGLATATDTWSFTRPKSKLDFRFDTTAFGETDYAKASLSPSPM